MVKKPAYATDDDLANARSELQTEALRAKEAGEKAAKDVRAELLAELGKVSQVVTTNAQTSKEAIGRVAEDAAAHAKSCSESVRTDLQALIGETEDKIKASQQNVENQLNQVDSTLKAMFADELMALTQQFDQELTAVKEELTAGMQKWAREAAEALVAQRRDIDASIEQLRQEAKTKDTAIEEDFGTRCNKMMEDQKKVDLAQDDRNERSQSETWLKLERLDDLLKEAREAAKEHAEDVDSRASSGISTLRSDAERRLGNLDEQAEKLHDAVAEVENIPTRRVDWVIKDVSKRIRPPSPEKACLHTSWFSPKFDMAGAHGLQLELQLFRDADPPVDGQHAGDCAAYLWACKGMNLVYKLYIGTKSAQLEKVFNGRVPFGTKRLCFLKDQINREEDSLRVSVEILEAVREVEHPIKAPPPLADAELADDEEQLTRSLEGRVVFRRHINNRLTDQVKSQVETMRSRMVRRVEWRLENASMLRRCFTPGEPMCSVAFAAAGVENLQLMFYPCGYQGATDGFCSLFLYAPAGATLKYTLYAGTHRRDATNFFEDAGAFGRTNYCRFDGVVEEDTDTILCALEIDEAHQDVVARVAHPIVAPGDRRTQSQIDAAVPAAVESVVKMQRAPGKTSGCLEDKRVLPSLWTAKSLGERSGPNDVHSFDDLKSAKPSGQTRSQRIEPASPAGSSPLSASRSMPTLTKEMSSSDVSQLPQLSKTSGDWSGSGIGPKRVRSSTRARRGMASTMQVLETGAVH